MNDNTLNGSADNNAESNAANETAHNETQRIEQVPPVPQPQNQAVPPTQVFETVADAHQQAPAQQTSAPYQAQGAKQDSSQTAVYPQVSAQPAQNAPHSGTYSQVATPQAGSNQH